MKKNIPLFFQKHHEEFLKTSNVFSKTSNVFLKTTVYFYVSLLKNYKVLIIKIIINAAACNSDLLFKWK